MVDFNWTCSYCGHAQAAVNSRHSEENFYIKNKGSKHRDIEAVVATIACANTECRELTLAFALWKLERGYQGGPLKPAGVIKKWSLLPESSAKHLPEYIPEAIRQDYSEACLIRDLSPKASATLTRRCLQGMIRDFCDIKKSSLIDEITELEKQVKAGAQRHVLIDTTDALTHVRKLGNIGAHMENNIDLIIDIDPNEAQTMINLLELLFDEWYIRRKKREVSLETIKSTAEKKEKERKETKKPKG